LAKVFKEKDDETKSKSESEGIAIINEWAKSTYLTKKQARSNMVLRGFKFFKKAIPILELNMAQSQGRKMNSAEVMFKAKSFEAFMKESKKESKLKNLLKGIGK